MCIRDSSTCNTLRLTVLIHVDKDSQYLYNTLRLTVLTYTKNAHSALRLTATYTLLELTAYIKDHNIDKALILVMTVYTKAHSSYMY